MDKHLKTAIEAAQRDNRLNSPLHVIFTLLSVHPDGLTRRDIQTILQDVNLNDISVILNKLYNLGAILPTTSHSPKAAAWYMNPTFNPSKLAEIRAYANSQKKVQRLLRVLRNRPVDPPAPDNHEPAPNKVHKDAVAPVVASDTSAPLFAPLHARRQMLVDEIAKLDAAIDAVRAVMG